MDVKLTSISVLASGALSVELHSVTELERPASTAVDSVTYRIYVPKSEVPDSISAIREMAMKAIREGK